ncbi:MAG: FecR domain-containing protein [Lentisphaeraceae bacterium]|nr:FecR domain-containing protein [Lentisphaeraceae bacterium]
MREIELFNRYVNKQLSDSQLTELKLLLNSEEGRSSFVRFMDESVSLAHSTEQMPMIKEEDECISKLVNRSEKRLLRSLQHKSKNPVPVYVLLSLAASLLVIFILYFSMTPAMGNSVLGFERSVARVTKFNGGSDLQLGDWLSPGLVTLNEGQMEITFDSGARVLLQGSVRLRLETSGRAFLLKGNLTAKVPKEAVGFIINTPQSSIVDLGTEFAVSVKADETTEVKVLEGLVEVASAQNGEGLLLKTGEALRIEESGRFVSIPHADFSKFVRIEDNQPRIINENYLYWPFENYDENYFENKGSHKKKLYSMTLSDKRKIWNRGKIGRGLNFSGNKLLALSDYRGVGGSNARSIAYWVRVPAGAKRVNAYAMVAWGTISQSEKWQLGWSPA